MGGLVSMPVMCSSSSRPSCEIRVEAGTAATRRDSTPRPFVYPYGVALAAAVARASSFVSLARSGPVRPMRVLCSCKSSADHKLKTEELPVRLPPSVCLPPSASLPLHPFFLVIVSFFSKIGNKRRWVLVTFAVLFIGKRRKTTKTITRHEPHKEQQSLAFRRPHVAARLATTK